ncbi:MAG: efflux transporter outer membrane subunit [Sphingomonadales bacterium]|nr:efflux transporter outer membrane subunit [Sphingomonadales bacterium]MDE2171592.1 efflux transporter outer membrane subunit [Sphingomonadales bacterium]
MRRLFAGVALLALAGCGVPPHVAQKPVIDNPATQGAFHEDSAQVATGDLPARWWHLYDDPVLDGLEEQALAANTDLRVAQASLLRARAVTQAAEGQHEPDFAASFAAERARLSGESYLLSEPIPVATLGTGSLEMSYQIDLFGRIKHSIEAARADEEATQATIAAVKVTLASEVARSYITVCGANEDLELAEKAVELQGRALDVARRLQMAGRTSTIEVTAAEERYQQLQALIPAQHARARAALYRLAYLMGRVPGDYPREAEGCKAMPQLKQPLPVGDGAMLLRRRPDVRVAERRLAAATARIGVATAELYPSVGIGISGGASGFLKDLGTAATNMWALGGLIHWNIPNAAARAKVRAAGADADAALAHYDSVVLGALRETETALNAYAQDHDRLVAITAAREAAEKAADEARRLRAGGRSPLLAAIGGEQGAVGARASELSAREGLAQAQVTLFLALGGGW